MSEATYELKDSFSYAPMKDGKPTGDAAEAMFVSFTAPNYRQIDKVTPLKQAFAAAVKEIQSAEAVAEAAPAGDSNEIAPETALQLLYSWSGDATKALLHAAALFKSGAALVDGETPITEALLDKLSSRDFEGMVGTYLVNFIIPSLMGGR